MINVSSNYLTILNEKSSVKSKSKIVVDGKEYISEIKSSPKISHKNKTIIGGFPIKTCNFEIYDMENVIDFQNKEVKVFKGIEVNGNFEYALQGIFIPRATQIKTNISQKTIVFESIQDKGQFFDTPYVSQLNWENKHTGKEIVQEICDLVNVELAYDNFNWSDYSFDKPNFKEGISCREVISKLAEIGGSIAIINSLGKLEIKSQKLTNHSVTARRYSKLSKEKKYGEINVVVLGKKDINDDIYYPETLPANKKEYKILDNPFVDLHRQEMISEVAKYVLGLSIIPFELENFIDGFCLELNDVINVTDKNNNTFNAVILNYETVNRITSKVGADVQDSTQTNYKLAGSTKQDLSEIRLDVDHNNKRIDALVSEQKQIEKDITTSKQVQGNPIEVNAAGEYNLESIGIDGKSYQETTTGKNKLLINPIVYSQNGLTITLTKQEVIINGTATARTDIYLFGTWNNGTKYLTLNGNYVLKLAGNTSGNVTLFIVDTATAVGQVTTNELSQSYNNRNITSALVRVEANTTLNNLVLIPMLYEGTSIPEVEKYTGGISSPNPEYPSEIETVQGVTNLFNPDTDIEFDGRFRNYGNGNISPNVDYYGFKIPVEQNTTYTVNTNLTRATYSNLCYYNGDTYLNGIAFTSGISFTTPANCNFVTLAVSKIYKWFQLEKGTIAHRYVPKGRWLEQITIGKNRFNKNTTTKNKTIDTNNGNVSVVANDRNTSDFIEVENAETYTCSINMTRTAYYDISKKYLNKSDLNKTQINIPNNAKYIRFSYSNSANDDNIQLEKGTESTPYEEYKENTALIDMNKPNEFKGELENGAVNGTTGALDDSASLKDIRVRTKDFIEINDLINTLYVDTTNIQCYIYCYDKDKKYLGLTASVWNNVPYSFISKINTKYIKAVFKKIDGSNIVPSSITNIKLYEGYEPYYEFAEVNDTKDRFLDGTLTKKTEKYIFTGNEEFFKVTEGFCVKTSSWKNKNHSETLSTHFPTFTKYTGGLKEQSDGGGFLYDNVNQYYIKIENITTVAELQAFLKEQYNAGTPVKIYYELEIPKTYQLSYEPLKLFKGYNYITLNDDLYPNMNIKYLTDSKFNAEYMTKSQFTIESNRINSEINKKVSNTELDEVIEEQNNKFTQEITDSANTTKSELTTTINTAKTEAINSANTSTDNKLKNYSTTTQMNNTIEQKITESENSINLSVSQKINDIQIGGTNLLRDTQNFWHNNVSANTMGYLMGSSAAYTTSDYQGLKVRNLASTDTTLIMAQYYVNNCKNGEKYTTSFYAKGNGKLRAYFYGPSGFIPVSKIVSINGVQTANVGDGRVDIQLTNDWKRYSVTYELAKTGGTTDIKYLLFRNDNKPTTWSMCGLKFEKGDKNSDWSPAPEDKMDNSKFTKAEIILKVNDGKSSAKIGADVLDVDAIATFTNNKLKDSGSTVINGDNITTGSIVGRTIKGGTIEGSEFKGSTPGVKLKIGTDSNGENYSNNSLELLRESDNSLLLSIYSKFWNTNAKVIYFRSPANRFAFMDGYVSAVRFEASQIVQTSLKKYKKNIEPFENGLDVIKRTDIYSYNLKNEDDNHKKHIGFVIDNEYNYAHEIAAINDDGDEIGVDSYSMISVCFKAIQEQQAQIDSLNKRIEKLEKEKADRMKKVIILLSTLLVVLSICFAVFILNQNRYLNEDVNKDGKVNPQDLLIVQKYILNQSEEE